MTSSSTKLSLKLLIDTKGEKVLFAEASKEVIDFLFSLLCLPLSTVIRLLSKNEMVGCIGNLYQSVEELNESYMQPDQVHKNLLLRPKLPISSPEISALLPPDGDAADADHKLSTSFYRCPPRYGACDYNVTDDSSTRCPNCSDTMNVKMQYVANKASQDKFPTKNGFVKEVVTYMVMDDLVVQPMPMISSITLLNNLCVKDIGALKEKVVEFGMTQGVNLLRASLQSKNVLTSVFLENNGENNGASHYSKIQLD